MDATERKTQTREDVVAEERLFLGRLCYAVGFALLGSGVVLIVGAWGDSPTSSPSYAVALVFAFVGTLLSIASDSLRGDIVRRKKRRLYR